LENSTGGENKRVETGDGGADDEDDSVFGGEPRSMNRLPAVLGRLLLGL